LASNGPSPFTTQTDGLDSTPLLTCDNADHSPSLTIAWTPLTTVYAAMQSLGAWSQTISRAAPLGRRQRRSRPDSACLVGTEHHLDGARRPIGRRLDRLPIVLERKLMGDDDVVR
jgi:hypothetical protein